MLNLTYIGHSQGSTQMFVALSLNPDFFKDKINLAIMLAPVATVHNSTAKVLQDSAQNESLIEFLRKIGPELLPSPHVDGKISSSFMKIIGQGSSVISLLTDSDPKLIS